MIKHTQLLKEIFLEENKEVLVDLTNHYPLGRIEYQGELEVMCSHDSKNFFKVDISAKSFDNCNYRYLKLKASSTQTIKIYMGLGYYATRNEEMSKMFDRPFGWSGADGIYSFNLDKEEDYNQSEDSTLFVFGDTFVGATDENRCRIEPTGFVNNTFGYLKDGKVDFVVNRNDKGAYVSLFEPTKEMQLNGYLPRNLTLYNGDNFVRGYISSQAEEKDIELTFNFNKKHSLAKLEVENFYDYVEKGVTKKDIGVKCLDIYYSDDDSNYEFLKKVSLDFYSEDKKLNIIELGVDCKFIKFVIKRSENQNNYGFIGLKKVYFYEDEEVLFDVITTSNSIFSYDEEKPYSWFWLQDGVVSGDDFYIFPCIIEQDKNGIEGFEFKIKGVAMLKMPLVDKKVDFNQVTMREVPLYRKEGNREYILPSAIYSEGEYLYLYGYYNEQDLFLRHLIVARIKKEDIYDLNNLRYFDGTSWVKDMSKAKSLLEHVSCEMSVQKIVEGENKGKYLAVFQYDTNGPLVAYSVGETPYGPFEKARIIYHTPEVYEYNLGTTYTYNAKAHLHLSSPRSILVSYNTNDMSMKCNKADYTIYHPRFLNFIDTSND